MRLLALVVTLSMALPTSPVLAKPGAIMIPPVAAELGAGTPLGDTASTAGVSSELRVGGSWASLFWKPTRLDVSVGYVGSYRALAPTVFHGEGLRARTSLVPDEALRLHGMYLELAYALENHRHWRTWLGARVETMTGDYQHRNLSVVGGALRIGSEVYSTGARALGGGRAFIMAAGAFAIGVYVEGVARSVPQELGPLGVGAGVTMRLPFILGVGC